MFHIAAIIHRTFCEWIAETLRQILIKLSLALNISSYTFLPYTGAKTPYIQEFGHATWPTRCLGLLFLFVGFLNGFHDQRVDPLDSHRFKMLMFLHLQVDFLLFAGAAVFAGFRLLQTLLFLELLTGSWRRVDHIFKASQLDWQQVAQILSIFALNLRGLILDLLTLLLVEVLPLLNIIESLIDCIRYLQTLRGTNALGFTCFNPEIFGRTWKLKLNSFSLQTFFSRTIAMQLFLFWLWFWDIRRLTHKLTTFDLLAHHLLQSRLLLCV